MSPPYGDTIQAIFGIYDQIFEALWNPYEKISDKYHKILNQLRERKHRD